MLCDFLLLTFCLLGSRDLAWYVSTLLLSAHPGEFMELCTHYKHSIIYFLNWKLFSNIYRFSLRNFFHEFHRNLLKAMGILS